MHILVQRRCTSNDAHYTTQLVHDNPCLGEVLPFPAKYRKPYSYKTQQKKNEKYYVYM